jgi:hypothetical protein
MTSVVNFFQHSFVQSVIASLLAALIVLLFSVTLSKSFRGALTALASTFLNIDVKYVFRNGQEAEPVIRAALEDGRTVKIFTSRGNEFQRELYRPLLDGRGERQVYLLLPAADPRQPFVKISRRTPKRLPHNFLKLTKSACYQPLIAPSAALQKNNS